MARDIFNGVDYSFKGLYSILTVFAVRHCNPYLPEWAKQDEYCKEECLENCFRYAEDVLSVLKAWKRRIDVIVVQHAYLDIIDTVKQYNWFDITTFNSNSTVNEATVNKNDVLLNAMTAFYSELEKIVKEVVFVPFSHYNFGRENLHIQKIEKAIEFDQNLDNLRYHNLVSVLIVL